MCKRKETTKTSYFTLEPDGFSIHTFELSRQLTPSEYYSIKNSLYNQQEKSEDKSWMYQDKYKNHICTLYKEYGIRIKLEYNQGRDMDTYFIRIIVNPRKLIDPKSSYIGILPPKESSIKKLKKEFTRLFEGTAFDNDINNYQLTRVDLCTNIRCDNKKLFRELVRVLRKMPTPPKYTREKYKHKDKKKANRYNKHYLRFHCGTHELIIYDKTYQMQDNNLVISYEKMPEGVLRFEVHCKRAYLRNVEKKSGKVSTEELLWQMVQESEERIINHFDRCFPDTAFVQMEEIERRIKASAFRGKNRKAMLELASQLQRKQSVDKALQQMQKDGYNTSDLLDKFEKLGISPIPLWKNFCAKELPGPVELLRAVSDGEVAVEYLKVKYK